MPKLIDISTPKHPNTFALVDEEEFEFLNQWKWFYMDGYALRNISKNGKKSTIRMHRVIMDASGNQQVDHKDLNPLNNQKSNLRLCTSCENNCNVGLTKKNKSGYKGVSFSKEKQKWRACIRKDKKEIHIGYYTDPASAAEAYNNAALKYHGEFVWLNQVNISPN